MATLNLRGCQSEPLSNYLKSLGVLRLVVEQALDPTAKGYWQGSYFCLQTAISADELTQFFLKQYQPTPLVNPWNGSTGFYPKDKAQKKLLKAIITANPERFGLYSQTIQVAQQQVNALGLTQQPKDSKDKQQLLTRLRNRLPDEAVKWLDTCTLITAEDMSFPPLMGTGGNDGNFEFSRTFIQQLQTLIDFETGEPLPAADLLLRAALFNATVPGLAFSGKIGQFNPIAAGGANAAPGYDADSRVNPWDFVLMLEGTLLFVSGATRRYEQSTSGSLAYPFTVRPSNVGYGSAAEGDKSRAELWTPLWSSPTGLDELQILFNEGRAKVGTRTAADGVDFARAISNFGVRRGLHEFVRYSFQERNGLSYFAVPLGRFQPHQNPQANLLSDIDSWLLRLKNAARSDSAPASLKRAHRRLEATIIRMVQRSNMGQSSGDLLEVLIALGQVEASLDLSLRNQDIKQPGPVPNKLDWQWIKACDDGSAEFRLALALAGQHLRERLVWVRSDNGYPQWQKNDDGKTIWQQGSLVQNLIALLQRQEIEWLKQQKSAPSQEQKQAEAAKSFHPPTAFLEDVALWIAGGVDDQRLEAIARGLSLVKSAGWRFKHSIATAHQPVPAAYALVKLVHYRHLTQPQLGEVFPKVLKSEHAPQVKLPNRPLPHVPGMLTRLATGQLEEATKLAVRRLRVSGYAPALTGGLSEPGDRPLRIAAALAFPLSDWDMAQLLKQVCRYDLQVEDD